MKKKSLQSDHIVGITMTGLSIFITSGMPATASAEQPALSQNPPRMEKLSDTELRDVSAKGLKDNIKSFLDEVSRQNYKEAFRKMAEAVSPSITLKSSRRDQFGKAFQNGGLKSVFQETVQRRVKISYVKVFKKKVLDADSLYEATKNLINGTQNLAELLKKKEQLTDSFSQ